MRWFRPMLLTVAAVLIVGCATYVPAPIRTELATEISVAEVRATPKEHVGEQVRWGGTIVSVRNEQQQTWIELVARELGGEGRPQETDRSAGRFLAVVDGFLDPAIFAEGRDFTVVGRVAQPVARKIGEFSYLYPVVQVSSYYLWPPEPVYSRAYDPYWYDPWYDPWWPYPYYPWRYRPYYYW